MTVLDADELNFDNILTTAVIESVVLRDGRSRGETGGQWRDKEGGGDRGGVHVCVGRGFPQ